MRGFEVVSKLDLCVRIDTEKCREKENPDCIDIRGNFHNRGPEIILTPKCYRLFSNFAGFDTAGADSNPSGHTINTSLNPLEVDIEATQGEIVSLAYAVSHAGLFSAYFANLCHRSSKSDLQYKYFKPIGKCF